MSAGATPLGRLPVGLTLGLSVLVAFTIGHGAVAAKGDAGPDPDLRQPPWQRLGPIGPRPAHLVAVSPDWPEDPSLLVARNLSGAAGPGAGTSWPPDMVLSRDGGRSWQAMPSPANTLEDLRLANAPGGAHVAFAWSEHAVFRSADLGTTWQSVLAPEDATIGNVQLSPSFASDGLAFALANGVLWRSRDAGQSWTSVEPVTGQWVQRVRFSPNFGVDNIVFVGLAAGPFPAGFPEATANGAPAGDPDSSAGVLVSSDRGDTWTPINSGLQVDDDAYQAIQELEISPTFARDHTLLALGWGPFEMVRFYESERIGQRAALFRSQDGGVSWEPVQKFEPSVTLFHVQLALSPGFDMDHIALEALSRTGLSPASYNCTVSWSDDAGASWIEKLPPGSYDWCQHLEVFGSTGGGFEATVLKPGGRYWSPDGGRSWGYASTPISLSAIVAAPGSGHTSSLFIPGAGGVWANGPGAVATDGMLPCAFIPTLGFGRVWSGNADVRAALGCALQNERSTRVRQREYVNQYCGPTRVLWPDDPDVPFFYELTNSTCGPRQLSVHQKESATAPLPEAPEQELQGAVQLFEGGYLLFVVQPDGPRSILVLPNAGQWAEFPD